MSQTLQIINLAVLIILMGYGFNALLQQRTLKNQEKKMRQDDEQEKKRWEDGALLASEDREYMACVNDITGLGKEYDPHEWYFKMPESAIKHLEVCFNGDARKTLFMKRAIELTIEHYVAEMADDAECARIIEERVFNNTKGSVPFDIEAYQKYREERIEKEGEFESINEWRIRMSPENGEEKNVEDNAS